MKTGLIISDQDYQRYFAERLYGVFGKNFVGIVYQTAQTPGAQGQHPEPKGGESSSFSSKTPGKGLIGKILNRLELKWFSGSQIDYTLSSSAYVFPPVNIYRTFDINDHQAISFIKDIGPELLLIFDPTTPGEAISTIPRYIIKLHLGYLPYYQSPESLATAIKRLDFRHIGATVLLLGKNNKSEIIDNFKPDLQPGDSLEIIQNKTLNAGLEGLLSVAEKLARGEDLVRYKQSPFAGNIQRDKEDKNTIAQARIVLKDGALKKYLASTVLGQAAHLSQSKRGRYFFTPREKESGLMNGVYIVLYHHISNQLAEDYEFYGKSGIFKATTETENFISHLEYFAREFETVSLDDAVRILREHGGNIPARYLAVTFDDGYKSVGTIAEPILARYGIPYAVMVNGNPVFNKTGLARLRLSRLMENKSLNLTASFNLRFGTSFTDWLDLFNHWKENYNLQYEKFIHEFWDKYIDDNTREKEMGFYLDLEDLKKLDSSIATIGSHTSGHAMLAHLSAQDQKTQIVDCHRQFERALGRKLKYFSYPFGGNNHFNHISEFQVLQLEEVIAMSAYGLVNQYFYPTNMLRISLVNYSVKEVNKILLGNQ